MPKSNFFGSATTNSKELLIPVVMENGDKKKLVKDMWGKEDTTLCSENLWRKIPKFLCHQEERKRRAEIKKSRLIQKLKRNYQINIDGLQEKVANEIIKKVETMEKEKKEKEKKNIERTLQIVSRLLEEQKYKRRAFKYSTLTRRKRQKKVILPPLVPPCYKLPEKSEIEEKNIEHSNEIVKKREDYSERVSAKTRMYDKIKSPFGSVKVASHVKRSKSQQAKDTKAELKETFKSMKEGDKSSCVEDNDLIESNRRNAKPAPLENCLECTPKRIIFQNYKRDEVYLQVIKITNVGLEVIHFRYLGIVVHSKHEERFPIGVAVRDSIKLRPGLSCSTKIRLCSQDDSRELECSIVYETRKQSKPLKHSFFFVPVVCFPARAIVQVSPLKISFPSVTWFSATKLDGAKFQKKNIKIENIGGKSCYCKIFKDTAEYRQKIEKEEEQLSANDKEQKEEDIEHLDWQIPEISKLFCEEEVDDERCIALRQEACNVANEILEELTGNVFATFRFSTKYYLVIPPFSTTNVEVRFIPEYKGFHHETHVIRFEGCHNCTEKVIELTGDIKKLPLIVEPQVIDFKTCVVNSGVYAASLKIFNTSKGPYSIYVKIPASLRNHAHIYPKGTVIQSNAHCDFSLRLYPRLTLRRDVPQYYNEDSGILEFPVFIYSANPGNHRTDYVKIYALAVVTNYKLELSPSVIDFGTVNTLETLHASISLTNHSLAVQEYAFLNLSKGVRIEPNMGFGRILPMESIPLYVYYSPVTTPFDETTRNHFFEIRVTSVAEYGGFRETLPREEIKSFESIWGEENDFKPFENMNLNTEFMAEEEGEDKEKEGEENKQEENEEKPEAYGECYEDNLFLEDIFRTKKLQEEMKIRDFLSFESETISENSFFNRIKLKQEEHTLNAQRPSNQLKSSKTSFLTNGSENLDEVQWVESQYERLESNVIQCKAIVVDSFCQLSESVIQMPATPYSSFSLYRFRLKGSNESSFADCTCELRQNQANPPKSRFVASFQFQYNCPQIKLEPQSGILKAGQNLAITIVYKPEFPANDLYWESRALKPKKLGNDKAFKKYRNSETPSKNKKSSQSYRKSTGIPNSVSVAYQDDLDKWDIFAGEKKLQELVSPQRLDVKISCVVKIWYDDEDNDDDDDVTKGKIETHDMILICPTIKPKFVYLGTSQEINFDKVFVGTRIRTLLKIQNISLERISPKVGLLNPTGSFSCLSLFRDVKIDPEHVWCQPLTYAPVKENGIEKEYFEIHCGPTNICLAVKGEAVIPQYKLVPNFACCLITSKLGSAEEIELNVGNLNSIKMKLQFVIDYAKVGSGLQFNENLREDPKTVKKETPKKAENLKTAKKTASEKKSFNFWEETPEVISKQLNSFERVKVKKLPKIISIVGVDDSGEIVIQPFKKSSVKIRFFPLNKIAEGELSSTNVYAINYKIMLERTHLLKEILVLGVILKPKTERNEELK